MEPTWFSGESICVLAQMRLNNVEKKKKCWRRLYDIIYVKFRTWRNKGVVWGAYVDIKNCIEKL